MIDFVPSVGHFYRNMIDDLKFQFIPSKGMYFKRLDTQLFCHSKSTFDFYSSKVSEGLSRTI